MKIRNVVTCFLRHESKVLLLKRSRDVRTHRGKWAGVSGTIESATPVDQALTEIREETGLERDDVRLIGQAAPLDVPDPENDVIWLVHAFLFEIENPTKVRLDWEHTECRWVDPADIGRFDTVPLLKETWELVGQAPRIQDDPSTSSG